MQPLLYESHMHTPLCKHAQGEPEEYAAAAAQRGLAGIIVTCHNPPIDGWSPHVRMAEAEFDAYVALVARARAAWAGRVDVRLGLECDFVPGMEDALAAQLARAEFHHVLGSVHPQIAAYRDRYFTGDALAFQRTYFEHLALAAETGLFDTLAHPDLVKNEFPQEWQPSALADTLAATLDRIAATGVAMELNTSGLQKRLPEMNPGPGILAQMAQRGIPVVLGADAHTPTRVAADYATGLDLLEAAGYTHVSLFLDRRRREVSVADARQSLRVSQPA
jgi:histidinol-phosphatase (PHP family)